MPQGSGEPHPDDDPLEPEERPRDCPNCGHVLLTWGEWLAEGGCFYCKADRADPSGWDLDDDDDLDWDDDEVEDDLDDYELDWDDDCDVRPAAVPSATSFAGWGIFLNGKIVKEFPFTERERAEKHLAKLLKKAPGQYHMQQIKRAGGSGGGA